MKELCEECGAVLRWQTDRWGSNGALHCPKHGLQLGWCETIDMRGFPLLTASAREVLALHSIYCQIFGVWDEAEEIQETETYSWDQRDVPVAAGARAEARPVW